MKRYILGFLAFVGLNFAGLFSLGMIVGFVMALGGERNADALEQSGWFNALVLVIWPIISFFALSVAFFIASGTSLALPLPNPMKLQRKSEM